MIAAGSKLLSTNLEQELSHVSISETEVVANSKIRHTLTHSIHQPSSGKKLRNGRRMPPKSPDLIELSDTGPSPLLSLEDDSSPPLTDVDSEDPQCDTESPTPTNSAASIDPQNYWQGTEEHRELLATEGEEDDDDEEDEQNLEGDKQIELVEISSSESDAGSSANHSSNSDAGNSYTNDVEEIDEEELWKISSEQLAYYKGQFKTLQPDPSGLLGGSQAKQFFEKSRLPLTELSRIWKLSDVTKDGALSLSEFCTAMHLVVLRRNNIALPDQLPPLLDPVNMFSNGSSSSGSGGVTQVDGGDKVVEGPSQTWIEFVDSPTGSVTSPGPRPVNFDFQRAQVEQNPRILHPVALRLTPESQSVDLASATGPISLPPCGPNLVNSLINAASNNTISNLGGKKEPPPPPPPRPYRGHTRSSSLDLNQLGGRGGVGLYPVAPPAVPPRVSPSMGSPRKDNEPTQASSGAFQVYRRPAAQLSNATVASDCIPKKSTACSKGLTSVIEDHRRRGIVLRKQQQLLAKQLVEIQEERASLEVRLQRIHLCDSR